MQTSWTNAHRSVLLEEVLQFLEPRPGGVYIDVTLGAGGHTEALLDRFADNICVIGIDRDASALQLAGERLARFGARFRPIHGAFGDLTSLLAQHHIAPVDGILADLGVSSMQLDRPERGFSFQSLGPIDMRMNPDAGETALDLIGRLPEETLADIINEYGEERYARRIARSLKAAHAAGELVNTHTLAQVIDAACPSRDPHKHPATRTFQALRIAVNDELRQVHNLLSDAPRCLKPGGKLVVISFHSLEDRLVKQHMQHAPAVVKAQRLRDGSETAPFALLTRKPVLPSDEEMRLNPRARSARLRAAVRVDPAATAQAQSEPTSSEVAAWPQ